MLKQSWESAVFMFKSSSLETWTVFFLGNWIRSCIEKKQKIHGEQPHYRYGAQEQANQTKQWDLNFTALLAALSYSVFLHWHLLALSLSLILGRKMGEAIGCWSDGSGIHGEPKVMSEAERIESLKELVLSLHSVYLLVPWANQRLQRVLLRKFQMNVKYVIFLGFFLSPCDDSIFWVLPTYPVHLVSSPPFLFFGFVFVFL